MSVRHATGFRRKKTNGHCGARECSCGQTTGDQRRSKLLCRACGGRACGRGVDCTECTPHTLAQRDDWAILFPWSSRCKRQSGPPDVIPARGFGTPLVMHTPRDRSVLRHASAPAHVQATAYFCADPIYEANIKMAGHSSLDATSEATRRADPRQILLPHHLCSLTASSRSPRRLIWHGAMPKIHSAQR